MIQASNEQNPKSTADNSVHFLYIVLALAFAALIGATIHTVRLAMAGHEPVMDKNYYEKGMNYEKEIAQSKQMSREGYRFDSTLMSNESSLQKGFNDIQIGIFQNQTPVNNAKLTLIKERTATSKFTEKKELNFDKDGMYKANLSFPHDGQWQITLTANVEGRSFEKTFMVNVK